MNEELPPMSDAPSLEVRRDLAKLTPDERVKHAVFLAQVLQEARAAMNSAQQELELLGPLLTPHDRQRIAEVQRKLLERNQVRKLSEELAAKSQLTLLAGGKS